MNTRSLLDRTSKELRRLRATWFPHSRRGRNILVVTLIVLLGGGAAGFSWLQATELPDNAAFRYNDRVVTTEELENKVNTLHALYGIQRPNPAQKQKLDQFRRDTAKAVAVSLILDDAAKTRGIVTADKAARDALDKFISQQIGDGPDARNRFISALGSVGTSERAVLEEIKRQISSARLFDKVTQGVTVNNAELHEEFEKRKNKLGTPEQREIYNIVVRNKRDAQDILTRLRNGASFERMATQWSLDGATRQDGGKLGVVTADQLENDYAKAAFAAEPNSFFGPVQTRHGWNVGEVRKIMPRTTASFEQVKEALKQTLILEKTLEKWRSWIGEQIKNADIEYADEYRPAHPDAPPTDTPGLPPR